MGLTIKQAVARAKCIVLNKMLMGDIIFLPSPSFPMAMMAKARQKPKKLASSAFVLPWVYKGSALCRGWRDAQSIRINLTGVND